MTAEKNLNFESIPIDNTDIFNRDVLKDITMPKAKLIFQSIRNILKR